MLRFLFLLISILILTGCSSGKGIGMVESPAWHQTADIEVKLNYFKRECLGFGYKSDTAEMGQCIQKQMNASKERAFN